MWCFVVVRRLEEQVELDGSAMAIHGHDHGGEQQDGLDLEATMRAPLT